MGQMDKLFYIRTRRSASLGSAAVETAVLLPFLLLLAMGTTDLGRVSHAYIAVATSARNAAQYGSGSKNASQDTAGIAAAARSEMSSVAGYSSSNPTVTSTLTDNGDGVKATVSFQFQSIIRYPGLPSSLTLTRTVEMRVVPIEVQDNEGGGDD